MGEFGYGGGASKHQCAQKRESSQSLTVSARGMIMLLYVGLHFGRCRGEEPKSFVGKNRSYSWGWGAVIICPCASKNTLSPTRNTRGQKYDFVLYHSNVS
jgi:hypothetical protein